MPDIIFIEAKGSWRGIIRKRTLGSCRGQDCSRSIGIKLFPLLKEVIAQTIRRNEAGQQDQREKPNRMASGGIAPARQPDRHGYQTHQDNPLANAVHRGGNHLIAQVQNLSFHGLPPSPGFFVLFSPGPWASVPPRAGTRAPIHSASRRRILPAVDARLSGPPSPDRLAAQKQKLALRSATKDTLYL